MPESPVAPDMSDKELFKIMKNEVFFIILVSRERGHVLTDRPCDF